MMSKTKLSDSSNKAKEIQDPFTWSILSWSLTRSAYPIWEHFEPIRCNSCVEKRTGDQDLYGTSGMHTLGAKV